jgi:hypothetical protein
VRGAKIKGPDACCRWIETEYVKLEDYEGRKVDRGTVGEGWDLRRFPAINRDGRNGGFENTSDEREVSVAGEKSS